MNNSELAKKLIRLIPANEVDELMTGGYNRDLINKLIAMVSVDKIDDLLDLSSETSRPMQRNIARHVELVVRETILSKTEVRDDKL